MAKHCVALVDPVYLIERVPAALGGPACVSVRLSTMVLLRLLPSRFLFGEKKSSFP